MRIRPHIVFYPRDGSSPVYKCRCGHLFRRLELLGNKPSRGTRDYCPKCKVKFIFTPRAD